MADDSEPKDQEHGERRASRPLPPATQRMLREKGTAAAMRPYYASALASFTRPDLLRARTLNTEKLLLRAAAQTVAATALQAKLDTLHRPAVSSALDRMAAALGRIQTTPGSSQLYQAMNGSLAGSHASAWLGRRALDALSPAAVAAERLAAFTSHSGGLPIDAGAMSALAAFRASAMSPSWTSALQQAAGRAQAFYPQGLLGRLTSLERRVRDLLLPENLLKTEVSSWPWLLRISVKDGVCLAWAPRAELIEDLMLLKTTRQRHRLLIDRRADVVDDVEESLAHVDHPALSGDVNFTLEAAECVRAGHDAAAQALLGNLLDTLMRRHGHAWLQGHFPQAQFAGTGSHKMVAGALGTRSGAGDFKVLMLAPYLVVSAMKNMFLNGVDQQDTFNRHLGAHNASVDSCRSEFALSALLTVQALLRQLDMYLYAEEE
ncbi:hypothetical protein AB0I66_41720 [Streptomyces sp. NPDC050439]|uniref:hypothetical protein n=1 Tax=unclassified Streptomyces TaxID=2593676 RepID=UPI003441DD7C